MQILINYIYAYNEAFENARLTVNKVEIENFTAQTKAICNHMQSLAMNNGNKFTDEILEATKFNICRYARFN